MSLECHMESSVVHGLTYLTNPKTLRYVRSIGVAYCQ